MHLQSQVNAVFEEGHRLHGKGKQLPVQTEAGGEGGHGRRFSFPVEVPPPVVNTLSRDDFLAIARERKFHLGETLIEFVDRLTQRFAVEMAKEASVPA